MVCLFFFPVLLLFFFFFNLADSMRKIKYLHSQFWKFLFGCFHVKKFKNKHEVTFCLDLLCLCVWFMNAQESTFQAGCSTFCEMQGRSRRLHVKQYLFPVTSQLWMAKQLVSMMWRISSKSCHKPSWWEIFLKTAFFFF